MDSTAHSSRNTSLDLVKAVAIAAVVMIHTSASFVTDYPVGSWIFQLGNFFDSISRLGVPLFVMASGALLLDEARPFSARRLFTKKLPQTIFLLFFWSAVYALCYQVLFPLLRGQPIQAKALLKAFLLGHNHMWYLFMLAGLYLALPVLRALVRRQQQGLVLLYLAVALLLRFTLLPLQILSGYFEPANYLVQIINKCKLSFFSEYVAYFLTGWYLTQVGIPQKKRRLLLYGGAILSIGTTIAYVGLTGDHARAYPNENIFIYLYAAGVFLALNQVRVSPRLEKLSLPLSKFSFGIYILHPVILYIMKRLLPKTWLPPVFLLVCWGLVFGAALLITWLLSRLPLLKRLVRA